jgi:hypothetical protein
VAVGEPAAGSLTTINTYTLARRRREQRCRRRLCKNRLCLGMSVPVPSCVQVVRVGVAFASALLPCPGGGLLVRHGRSLLTASLASGHCGAVVALDRGCVDAMWYVRLPLLPLHSWSCFDWRYYWSGGDGGVRES